MRRRIRRRYTKNVGNRHHHHHRHRFGSKRNVKKLKVKGREERRQKESQEEMKRKEEVGSDDEIERQNDRYEKKKDQCLTEAREWKELKSVSNRVGGKMRDKNIIISQHRSREKTI